MLTDDEKDAIRALIEIAIVCPDWEHIPNELKELLLSADKKLKE